MRCRLDAIVGPGCVRRDSEDQHHHTSASVRRAFTPVMIAQVWGYGRKRSTLSGCAGLVTFNVQAQASKNNHPVNVNIRDSIVRAGLCYFIKALNKLKGKRNPTKQLISPPRLLFFELEVASRRLKHDQAVQVHRSYVDPPNLGKGGSVAVCASFARFQCGGDVKEEALNLASVAGVRRILNVNSVKVVALIVGYDFLLMMFETWNTDEWCSG